jgi:DNA-binding NtrC family response regulator
LGNKDTKEVNRMKKKILLVDDEPDLLEFVGTLCSDIGYEVATAQDGLDAILMVITNDYDVMMTNIKMPIINGLELLQMAKEIKSDLKVIICTGLHDMEEEANKYGAYAYFKKPIIVDTIKDCLRGLNSKEK